MKFLKDNRGLSLVELIVSMLIMVAVSGMIFMFINMSTTSFRLISKQQTLQTEAQTATDFITEVLQGAQACGMSSYFGTPPRTGKCIWIQKGNGNYGFVLYDAKDRVLRYKEMSAASVVFSLANLIDYGTTLSDLFGDDYSTLATCVDDIILSTESVTGSTGILATVKLSFKLFASDGSDEAYETSFKVINRNARNE